MENNQTQNKMGVMPIGKLLFTMALPMMISMLTQACYNIVDSIFVARVSENALTAVSLAFPIQMLITSTAVGTGIGINSLISRRLGEKRVDDASKAATNGLFLMFLSGLFFMLLGLTVVKPFFAAFTDDIEIATFGETYLSIVLIFSLGVFLEIGCSRIIQATGNTVYPMLMQLTGAVVNLALDPILIFGYFGFPAMGIAGAAIATVMGQWIAMALSFYLLFGKKHVIKPRFGGFRPDKRSIKDIYIVGVPSIVMQAIGSVMTLGLNKILIFFTPTAVSVLGVYFKLNSFVTMPVIALNSGAMSIMGYNFGAHNRPRMMKTLKLAIFSGLCIMVAGILVFHFFTEPMLRLFDATPDMLAIGVPALRIISLSFVGMAICVAFSNLFQAIGKGILSLLMSLLRQLVIILPLAYLLAMTVGLEAVWFSFLIAEVISIGVAILFFRHIDKTMLLPMEQDQQAQMKVQAAPTEEE